jgi:hypothetical protein
MGSLLKSGKLLSPPNLAKFYTEKATSANKKQLKL